MLNRISTTATIVALATCVLFISAWVISGVFFAVIGH
jgi:hypothetical protein